MIVTLGIDTGDTAGMLLAGWEPGHREAAFARAFQCDGDSAPGLLSMILAWAAEITAAQIEAFDDRPGVRKLYGTRPSVIRAQVTALGCLAEANGIPVFVTRVAEVKPWIDAGDTRLARAGLADNTAPAAMRHARSAAWHALFCAVRHCGVPDPASRKAAAR